MSVQGRSPNSLGELALLTQLLGDSAKVKIIAAMLSEDFHDLSVTQIANVAGVHRTTVYEHLEDLEELDVIVNTRTTGGSPMYQINQDSRVAKQLKNLELALLDEFGE